MCGPSQPIWVIWGARGGGAGRGPRRKRGERLVRISLPLFISLSTPPAAACRPGRQDLSCALPAHLLPSTLARGTGDWRLGRAGSSVGCVQCLVDTLPPHLQPCSGVASPPPASVQASLWTETQTRDRLAGLWPPIIGSHSCTPATAGTGLAPGSVGPVPALGPLLSSLSCLWAHFCTSLSPRTLSANWGYWYLPQKR